MLSILKEDPPSGALLRPVGFEPTSNKWSQTLCRGFQIHVTDPDCFNAYGTGLRLLRTVLSLYRDHFSWKSPPYEYDHENLPIDLILGDKTVRERLCALEPVRDIEASFQKDLSGFEAMRKDVVMY
jgi:uncharacterized protein YbbC (DUF1343 family)